MTGNNAMHDDNDPLRRHLGALPDPALPEALWPRVASARQRQVARRRLALGGGIAVVLAVLVLPFRLHDPGHPPGPGSDLAAGATPAREPVASDPGSRLRTLDRELQAAYRRGSDAAEIAQLWQAREALLRESGQATPVRPVRI